MARKRGQDGPRGRGSRTDLMNAFRSGERSLFVLASKTFVVLLFIVFAGLSVGSNSVLVAALAGVGVFVIAAVLLPIDDIRERIEWFTSGDAGEWLHSSYLSIIPGRSDDDRRGQIDLSRLLVLGMVVVLVSSLLLSGLGAATQDGSDSTDSQCADVVHDGYLTDDSYVEEYENSSQIELTNQNVRTTIEETDAFVRLKADNPNSYCVNMTVKVHPDIIPPAEVGELSDTDGDVDSTWRNTHDFERDQSYTEITFTIGADSDLTFAPNKIRIHTLAWKDKTTSSGILDKIKSPLGDSELDKRSYTLDSANGSIQTVPLENSDGDSVDEWLAVYRVGDDKWRPITTDSSDPAFYRVVDNNSAVQFHFDTDSHAEGQVEVEFTANPTDIDKLRHDWRSYSTSWRDMFNFNFDIVSVVGATFPAAEVAR